MDSGSSTGEIAGHSKTIKTHTKFVQDVQYAPSGDHFVSVGSDAKIFLYDGKTGDTINEFTASPHTGRDVQNQKAVTTWKLGSRLEHQQIGSTWSGERDIVSLSISGDLNIFDPRLGDKPSRVLSAPQKAITATSPTSPMTFLGGTADGRLLSYSTSTGESEHVPGTGHSNLISGLASYSEDRHVFSIGYDDHVRELSLSKNGTPELFTANSVATTSQPKSVAVVGDGTVFVSEINTIEAFKSNQRVLEQVPKFVPSAIAASKSIIAIGGEDQKVRLNEWDGQVLKENATLEGNKGVVTSLAFSPDGKLLASGDSIGRIALFDVQEKKLITSRWSFHSARINAIAWTSDSLHCASASLDTHVYVWSVAKPMKNIAIKNAVPGGANSVLWLKDEDGAGFSRLVTSGADGCARLWEVTFHA
ncbi:hypothetical protein DXG03_007921 [Asterophora parasitica]|uniref:Anaphase-promoting complex subunit 4-like WD40 domain-containing protein n=1 Tax=Asterophora parasitica TaxID=117018 RepID=A0A9P7KBM0_9AGAR|nr:hypothetical protein DXG03_007921 [Asterophora parasitica]